MTFLSVATSATTAQDTVVPATTRVWSDDAIRDTVAAIVRQDAYARDLTETVWESLVRWVVENASRLLEMVSGSPAGRMFVLMLLAAIAAFAIIRLVSGAGDRDSGALRSRARRRSREADHARDAERLAASGDYLAAAHALCAAALDACAARGELRLHRSRTTGEYARELRRARAPSAAAFQTFRTRYDRLVFGDAAIGRDEYDMLHAAVRPLLAGTAAPPRVRTASAA